MVMEKDGVDKNGVAKFSTLVTQNKYCQMLIHSFCIIVGGRKRIGPDQLEKSILG